MAQELVGLDTVEQDERRFELAQRKAKIYATSELVPKEYRNNIGNCLIAMNMSQRTNADVLMVMQHLYMVHNRPAWSAQFLIACLNNCGRFTPINYRFTGERNADTWGCVAWCRSKDTDEVIEGCEITIKMAKDEGWYNRNGSKWKTMPEQMLRYRSATFLVRAVAPELGLGFPTKDEVEDMVISQHFENDHLSQAEALRKALYQTAAGESATLEVTVKPDDLGPVEQPLLTADEAKWLDDFTALICDCHTSFDCDKCWEQLRDDCPGNVKEQALVVLAGRRQAIRERGGQKANGK